jgi:hypothetical protein
MHKQYKDLLRAVVTALRHRLAGTWDEAGVPIRGDLDRELERLGFAPDGAITPIDALVQPTDEERRAYQAADARIAPFAAGAARCLARAEFVERAAYTWINRLLALRTMEARELIDETLRPNDAYNGISEALYLLRHSAPARTQGPDAGWQAVLDDACAAFAPTLPGLFDPADPNAALRPAATALLDCIRILGGRLPAATYAVAEVDAAFRDPDALGWAYQFYQQEAKDRVYAKLGSGGKIETRSEIAAATQLFTEPYMVKWMLQNSLGRTYHETYPASKLPATWEYYIRSEERDGRGDNPQSPIFQSPISLSSLTLLDPSMGSGHILREGFDMLFAMYREQHPALEPAEIARRILAEHLYGIDIDPRAAQLAALTLLLRAWETVRLHHSQFTIHHSQFVLNLATTPILAPGALARHLDHHPADAIYRPILAGVFAALEQAHLLGSLLRPEEHLDAAIAEFRRQSGRGGGQMGLLGESTAANRLLEELGKSDPAELKRLLLARVGRSFAREAAAGDVGSRLLGREAGEGVHLLQLLDKRYSVVCTNPPYMGSTNMDAPTKRYVEQHYKAGKRDLYAAFILRCLDLCKHAGRVAMITQQSWMFLTSFADLRAVPEDVLAKTKQKGEFTGLLRETTIEGLAHLGSSAFEEIEGVVVSNSMFSIVKIPCAFNHKLFSLRLTGLDTPAKKDSAIVLALTQPILEIVFRTSQVDLLRVENTPITYWLGPSTRRFLDRLQLGESTRIVQQVITADNSRFLRYSWETSIPIDRWWRYVKGGGYRKWAGLENMRIEWDDEGIRLKESITAKYPYLNGNWSWLVKAESLGLPSLTYTLMAQGSLGVRRVRENTLCDSASPTIVFRELIPGIA